MAGWPIWPAILANSKLSVKVLPAGCGFRGNKVTIKTSNSFLCICPCLRWYVWQFIKIFMEGASWRVKLKLPKAHRPWSTRRATWYRKIPIPPCRLVSANLPRSTIFFNFLYLRGAAKLPFRFLAYGIRTKTLRVQKACKIMGVLRYFRWIFWHLNMKRRLLNATVRMKYKTW